MIDDPRGDHAVGRGDGRTIQFRDDELGVGTEVGRHTHQGHRTGVLADEVRGGDDGVVDRDGTLLDRDEVAALHIDRTKGLGNECGRGGRTGHPQITAAQIEHRRVGEAEIVAGDGEAVAAEHEAGDLSGGDREAGVKDVDGRVTQLRAGTGVVTANLKEAGDIKQATGREDVLQRAVRDQELALPIDRGAATVGLDGVQHDDTAMVTGTPDHRPGQRITDDQARRRANEDARVQGQLSVAGAEAIDVVGIHTERGRRISLGGGAGTEEPRSVTGRVAADEGHVNRGGPTAHRLQRAAVGTGHRRAEGRTDGEVTRQEQATDAAHARGSDPRGRMLGVVGDVV